MPETGDFLSAAERVAGGGSALDPHVVAHLLSGAPPTTHWRR